MSDLFLVERDNRGVVTVTLNRAEIHNAFNDELIAALTQTFHQLSDEVTVRVVVLTGNGRSFCAGADLNWMKKMVNYSFEENIADSRKLAGLFHAINRCKKPVIARVQGAALGGGVGLVAACDYVVAVERAKFGFTEVRLGIIPAVISPFVIEKIGVGNARAFFLSGMRFSAGKAEKMGLVHEVVTDEKELDIAIEQQIQEYLIAAPNAVSEAKELIRQVVDRGSKECHEYTYQQIAKLRISTEGQEGMNALLEKRKPNWIKE